MSRVQQDFCENAELSEWGFAPVAWVSEHPDTWNTCEGVTCWGSPCCFSHPVPEDDTPWRNLAETGVPPKPFAKLKITMRWPVASGHSQFETHLWTLDSSGPSFRCSHPAWKGLDFNSHIPLTWEPLAVNCLCNCKDGLGLSCLRNGALFINQGSSPQDFIYCTLLNAQPINNPLPIQDLRSLSRKCSFSLFFLDLQMSFELCLRWLRAA